MVWLDKRPDVAGEPEGNPIGRGCFYRRGAAPVVIPAAFGGQALGLPGLAWARRADRLYRLEVLRQDTQRAAWELFRDGAKLGSGIVRTRGEDGLRGAIEAAQSGCERCLRLDTTDGVMLREPEPEKRADHIESGRKAAELRHSALRQAAALQMPAAGGPERAGERLRWARSRKDWPYSGLALRAGISPASAQRMEVSASGLKLPFEIWLKAAEAVQVCPVWLLHGVGHYERSL